MNDTETEICVKAEYWSPVVWHNFSTHRTAVKHKAVVTGGNITTLSASSKTTTCLLIFHCLFFSSFPQLEDDIIAKPDYIQSIKNFAAQQSEEWMILEFSQLGFIGKLLRHQQGELDLELCGSSRSHLE